MLERFDGSTWTGVGRYGSLKDATAALDELMAAGEEPDALRVIEVGSRWSTAWLVVAAAATGVAAAIVLYVVFG